MSATKTDIAHWFDRGKAEGATHLIVVCDTWDWSDYPIFVRPGQDVHEIAKAHNGPNMQKVMEVYCLGKDKAAQLAEHRSFHYENANE